MSQEAAHDDVPTTPPPAASADPAADDPRKRLEAKVDAEIAAIIDTSPYAWLTHLTARPTREIQLSRGPDILTALCDMARHLYVERCIAATGKKITSVSVDECLMAAAKWLRGEAELAHASTLLAKIAELHTMEQQARNPQQ